MIAPRAYTDTRRKNEQKARMCYWDVTSSLSTHMNLESPMKHAAAGFPEDELMRDDILNVDATGVWTRAPDWKKNGKREEAS